MDLKSRDRKFIWHPFTQEAIAPLPIPIVKGKGAFLYDEEGKEFLDLISSWWVNLHGHAHPKIRRAIYKQSKKLEQVIFAGFTHEPAIKLCEKLSSFFPNGEKFFFSDNGSTAVEVALKIAYQFWQNKGECKRTRFLSLEGGYHGDTFGAMAVGKSGFHDSFKELCFPANFIPTPFTWIGDEEVENKEKKALKFLDEYLEKGGNTTVCFIAEPLLQGAGGMRLYRASFLKEVITRLRKYNIITIFDEVLTGFGRTGTNFAFEQVGIVPDIICLSKGLTGGFLPLAITGIAESIYKAFLDNDFKKALAHGHSYTANPLGCTAALSSLDLLLKPATQNNIKTIEKINIENLALLQKKCPKVTITRCIGTIAAFNFPVTDKLKAQFLERGLLLRPLGNNIYLLPPYCIDKGDLQRAYDLIRNTL